MKEVESDIREFKHTKVVFSGFQVVKWKRKRVMTVFFPNYIVLSLAPTLDCRRWCWCDDDKMKHCLGLKLTKFAFCCVAQQFYIFFCVQRNLLVSCLPIKFSLPFTSRPCESEEKSVNLTWFWYLNYTFLLCAFQTIELYIFCWIELHHCQARVERGEKDMKSKHDKAAPEAATKDVVYRREQQHVEWGFDIFNPWNNCSRSGRPGATGRRISLVR